MTSTTQTFSPDGMRGGEIIRHHEASSSHREHHGEQKTHHASPKIETDNSHDFYDDGLVHCHAWAASAPCR